jgi:hypothetical protein
MKDANSTSAVPGRWIVGILDTLVLAMIVFFIATNNVPVQINFVLAAFCLGLLGVLSVAAWRHGFRWFLSRRALPFYAWLVVGVISVTVLLYAEESWRGKRAWAALQREAAARGESLELSSVFPPPVPDDENFALTPGLPRLLGYVEPEPGATWRPPDFDSESQAFFHGRQQEWPAANWALQQATDLAAWQAFFRQHPLTNSETASNTTARGLVFPFAPQPQTPAADVLLALSRYDSALALLRAADRRPKVRYPLAYDKGLFALISPRSFHAENLRAAVHILSLRAVAELDQNQSEAALRDTLLALRLADSLAHQPYEPLHRFRNGMLLLCLQPVWEGLVSHRWSEAQLHTLQQRFAGLDLLAEFRLAARGDALVTMNLADQFHAYLKGQRSSVSDHIANANQDEISLIFGLFRVLYPVGWLYQDKVWIYRFYERRAEVSKALDPANQQQWHSEVRRAIDPALLIMVAPRLQETFREFAERALYLQTACQEAATACALERCRLAQGQYPTSLDALVPTWLKQVPADLLAVGGAPLKYRREADGGFVLYSVGLNHVDDQGKPGSLDKEWRGVQSNSPRLDEGDWVWRQAARP